MRKLVHHFIAGEMDKMCYHTAGHVGKMRFSRNCVIRIIYKSIYRVIC